MLHIGNPAYRLFLTFSEKFSFSVILSSYYKCNFYDSKFHVNTTILINNFVMSALQRFSYKMLELNSGLKEK